MGTKKTNAKAQRRESKIQEVQRKKGKKIWTWIVGSILVLGLIYRITLNVEDLPGEAVDVMSKGQHLASLTSPHDPYSTDPPTSGPHVENMANWGVYTEVQPKELLVHNLEDGGIVIYYNQESDQQTLDQLQLIAEKYPKNVVAAPYPEMKNRITLTAWGRIDRLDQVDIERMNQFIDRYKGFDHH